MNRLTTGASCGITKQQLHVLEMMADGESMTDIAKACFKCTVPDPDHEGQVIYDQQLIDRAKYKIKRWRKDENIQAAYDKILNAAILEYLGPALKRLGKQLESNEPWLVNKAANDILRMKGQLTGDAERNITVRFDPGVTPGTPEPIDVTNSAPEGLLPDGDD